MLNNSGGVSKTLLTSIIAVLSLIIIVGIIYIGTSGTGGDTVKIEAFGPSGEVPQTTNFTVTFSREVAPDSLLDVALEASPITFSPKLPGRCEWIARDKLRFYPEVKLAPSTRYTAEVTSKLTSDFGFVLRGERRFAFVTPQFRVISAILSYDLKPETDQQADLVASVEFNYAVDPSEAGRNISIVDANGSKIPFEVETQDNSAFLSLKASNAARGQEAREIYLKIAKGLKCLGGDSGLLEDHVTPLNLPGRTDLLVESVLPTPYDPATRAIRIEFNLPVSPEVAGRYVAVEPPVAYKITGTHRHLDLRGSFDATTTYQVKVTKGLRAIDGSELKRDFAGAVTLARENIPPQVDFVGQGFYLTRTGDMNVGVATINVDKVSLEVQQVFANNLVYLLNANDLAESGRWYDWVYNMEAMGRTVKEWDQPVENRPNDEVVTPVNVRDYLDAERPGIYRLTARDGQNRWNVAAKWVVATDLGILVKKSENELWVWVNSLSKLQPLANAKVTLLSRNNQKLAEVTTNGEGIAIFRDLAAFDKGLEPYLILASLGQDLSFVEITRRLIPTTDFDVDGAPFLVGGYEGYLYLERDIYRPGETAHFAAIVRGANAAVPQAFPVRFRVTAPDGKIINEQKATLNSQGGAEFSATIPDYLLTGRYSATLLIGENLEIGRARFSVEEFMPDRMKVTLKTDKTAYSAGESIKLDVDAVTLFGPPASGRAVRGEITVEPFTFTPEKFKSFNFADATKQFKEQKSPLADAKLNDQGRFTYTIPTSAPVTPPSALRGVISVTVLEPGGRGVTAYIGAPINPYPAYVGLRPAQEGYGQPNRPTKFEFVAVDPNGSPQAGRAIDVVLQHIYWQSILRNDPSRGYYRYVSEQVVQEVDRFTVTSTEGIGNFDVTPDQYGKYRVIATDSKGGGSASQEFYSSGWGYSPWAMDNPDRIELDLDKEAYLPGETAIVQVRAPFSGKLLLTVEREKVFTHQIVQLKENTATLRLTIAKDWKPNVYVSAHLIRSTEKLERDTPVRAFGVVRLKINTDAQRLAIDLQTPSEIRPNSDLTIKFDVNDMVPAAPYVTIAAVDEGICQLTDMKTPDPHGFFFSKKKLAVESYDLYSAILPEILLKKSPAGDIEAARRRQLTPSSLTRVKPVAFWSGLVKANADGTGSVTFKVPQFNGQLRIMAAAFGGDRFGSTEKHVYVREPLVLTPTFPRFLSSTDELIVPVGIYNGTGRDGRFTVSVKTEGPATVLGEVTQTLQVSGGREAQAYFRIKAGDGMGAVKFTVAAGGNGVEANVTEDVPLRPPVPFVTLAGQGSVTAAAPALFKLPADFIPGTGDYALTVSSFPAVRFAGSLQYLLSYPHGCLEQTTSKLFPMLYFDDLARLAEPELFKKNSVDYFIEEGIAKLANMQLTSGAFMYWPQGSYQHNWSSVYATHFLVEARRAGYTVPDRVYDRALNALRIFARNYPTHSPGRRERDYGDDSGEYYSDARQASHETATYANYVLALAGKPDRSTMNFLRAAALERLSQYSQYQLAGAYALLGDLVTARTLMPNTLAPRDTSDRWESGGNFNSPIRAQAIMLDILAEVEPASPLVPKLVESLMKSTNDRSCWHTTQENAFALMALGKIFRKQGDANYTGTVKVDGAIIGKLTPDQHDFRAKDWAGKTIEITLAGSGTAYFYWRADGLPAALKIDEYDRDLQVRRRFLDENGNPLTGGNFRQGDLIIAELTIKAPTEAVENVAIVDLLPSAFEIENPRLQSRQAIKWMGEKVYQPRYMDIRDDRMIIYGDFATGREEKFYYGLRVVSAGTFILPPVRAEAMYAPMISSVASSGKIAVTQP